MFHDFDRNLWLIENDSGKRNRVTCNNGLSLNFLTTFAT